MLTKLPGSKWWIETDDTGEIVATYNKAQITADIKSIKETLGKGSVKEEEAQIIQLAKDNVGSKALIEKMAMAYEGSIEFTDRLNLENKLDSLVNLRERLV